MPKMSFETSWPCDRWYYPDGTRAKPGSNGAEPCFGHVDSSGKRCAANPYANRVRGIMRTRVAYRHDGVGWVKRRVRCCIFCGAEDMTSESKVAELKDGCLGSIYANSDANHPSLFDKADYITPQ